MVIKMKLLKWLLLCPLVFALAGCILLNQVKWQNSAGVSIELFGPSGDKLLVLEPDEKSRAWKYWDYDSHENGGDWLVFLRARGCTYKYKQPDIDAIQDKVASKEGSSTGRPFLLVVDPQFVIHLEYPENWQKEKPAIAGFPAVPAVTCQ